MHPESLNKVSFRERTDDLIHADKYGAIVIPVQHTRQVIDAGIAVEHYERPAIELCQSPQLFQSRAWAMDEKPNRLA